MVDDFDKCPECGSHLIKKQKRPLTFDGVVVDCECQTCGHIWNYNEQLVKGE